jgi:hypothetical protein
MNRTLYQNTLEMRCRGLQVFRLFSTDKFFVHRVMHGEALDDLNAEFKRVGLVKTR